MVQVLPKMLSTLFYWTLILAYQSHILVIFPAALATEIRYDRGIIAGEIHISVTTNRLFITVSLVTRSIVI